MWKKLLKVMYFFTSWLNHGCGVGEIIFTPTAQDLIIPIQLQYMEERSPTAP